MGFFFWGGGSKIRFLKIILKMLPKQLRPLTTVRGGAAFLGHQLPKRPGESGQLAGAARGQGSGGHAHGDASGPPQAGPTRGSFFPRQLGTGLRRKGGNCVPWQRREGGLGDSHVTREGALHPPAPEVKDSVQGGR